jgi:cytochrome c oxidase assembly protein subunit 15
MSHPAPANTNIGLHRFALFTAGSTAFLIFVGGLVTSTESGLAVPDWPLSYGMFFPPMVGGIFYEHGHRMVASFVGLLTVILAIWMCISENRAWVRWLSIAAFLMVLLQGILGGLTVLYLLPTSISMTHACLAQTFFCLTVALALFTSPVWKRGLPVVQQSGERPGLGLLCSLTTAAVYVQLILGAWMRHTDSGLAIPDFPLAFGRVVPPFDSPNIAIHFAHRVGGVIVTSMIVWTFARVARGYRQCHVLYRPATIMLVLVILQFALGALTVLTAKSVVPTTLHVVTGALVLATSVTLSLRAFAVRSLPGVSGHPVSGGDRALGEPAWR